MSAMIPCMERNAVRDNSQGIPPEFSALQIDRIEFLGRVSDLHFIGLNPQPEFVPIDEQPDDDVMHLHRFGEANRLTRQPLDSGA